MIVRHRPENRLRTPGSAPPRNCCPHCFTGILTGNHSAGKRATSLFVFTERQAMNVIGTSILGLVVVVWALWETFQDLFQPSGSGSLSSFVGRRLFQIARRVRWMLPAAGPLSVVVVIACWAALVAAGFALIYWGRSPGAFSADATEPRDALGRFAAVRTVTAVPWFMPCCRSARRVTSTVSAP